MREEEKMHTDKRNGAMRIFEALSSVDEELLERSEEKERVIPFWKYAKVMAACVCFLVLGVATYAGTRLMSSDNAASDSAAPEEVQMAADMVGNIERAEDTPAEYAALEDTEVEMEAAVVEEAADETTLTEGATKEHIMAEQEMLEDDSNETGLVWDMGSLDVAYERLDEATLRKTDVLSNYIPTEIPAGYEFVDGSRYNASEGPMSVSLTWYKGMDYISVTVMEYMEEEELEARLVDISIPETYDVHLYEIPYASSVPEEVRSTFNNPVFAESDLSIELIKTRMKRVSEQGDTNTPRGNFGVLYDSGVVVVFSGRSDAEAIWNMFQSVGEE